jgi:hypothetical protein
METSQDLRERGGSVIQSTFEQNWRDCSSMGRLDSKKLREVFETVKQEGLWDCPECSFVGYVLLRCEPHHGRAWARGL